MGDSVTSLSSGQNRLPENLMNGQMLLERTWFRRTSSTANFSPAPCIGKIWREKGAACPSEHHFHMFRCQCFSVFGIHDFIFRTNVFGERTRGVCGRRNVFTFTFGEPCSQVPYLRFLPFALVFLSTADFVDSEGFYKRVIVFLFYRL